MWRALVLLFSVCGASLPVAAQTDWARAAVPTYNPAQLVHGLHVHWMAPRADELVREARTLGPALQQWCDASAADAPARKNSARDAWRRTALAWDRLSAVAVGPVVERRSQRQIDFTPTRPALIEKAIATAPRSGADMERIGTPAKGLPALEWLLWAGPAESASKLPAPAGCAYAVLLAAEVEQEAAALQAAFAALAARGAAGWDNDAAVAGMNEFVNQWVGGLERLRWTQMDKPLRSGQPDDLPRALSGTTAASWGAQWQTLQALAVFAGRDAPVPGAGLVPIETYLRGRGLNPVADRLLKTTGRAALSVDAARPTARASVQAAARDLAALKQLAEAEIAPALSVSIGFSDADGD